MTSTTTTSRPCSIDRDSKVSTDHPTPRASSLPPPSSNQSPARKPKKAKQQKNPEFKEDPKLRSSLKEQLKARAEAIPDFDPASAELKSLDVNALSWVLVRTKDVGTFTTVEEFNVVERFIRGVIADSEMSVVFQGVKSCFPRDLVCDGFNSGLFDSPPLSPNKTLKKLKLEKGCDTSDLEVAETAEDTGLMFLKTCFPDVSDEDLTEMLQRCEGDTEWAVNILLDSGYEYNVSGGAETDQNRNVISEDQPDEQVQAITMVESATSAPDSVAAPAPIHATSTQAKLMPIIMPTACTCTFPPMRSPSPLLELCHNLVSPTGKSPFKMQEKVAENSVRRLRSIEAFKRSHSKDDSDVTSPRSGSKIPLLDLSPSTVFDAIHYPFEGIHQQPHVTTRKSLFQDRAGQTPRDVIVEEGGEEGKSVSALNLLATSYGEQQEADRHATSKDSSPKSVADDIDRMSPPTLDSDLTLTLSSDLARQLIEMFGPVGFHISPDSLDAEDLRVGLSRKVGKKLHRCWALTLQEKFDREENAVDNLMRLGECFVQVSPSPSGL